MIDANPKVDNYLAEGCGRCPLGSTPNCKVHFWPEILQELRRITLECGLTENLKWGVPCYTFGKSNILIVAAFKNYASISFFKGSLLRDENELLEKAGENSQAGRLVKFTQIDSVINLEPELKSFIFEAIELEKSGIKIEKVEEEISLPEELIIKLSSDKDFKLAFEALTPGRRKGYILHFNQAKSSKTRINRIEKSIVKILSGKGHNER